MHRLETVCSVVLLLGLLLVVPTLGADKAVRLGYLQSDLHHLACFVALEKRFFSRAGVNVEVGGIFRAGPEEMSAFAAGALDVGYVGEAPATVAVANGTADVKIVAQVNLEGSAIVIRKEAGRSSLRDLIGATVAVPGYATVQDFLFCKALENLKIPSESVNKMVLKTPEMIPALRAKQIDAFVAWEPYPSKAIHLEVGDILLRSRDVWPNHPCCVLVVDNRYLTAHPETVKRLVKAHGEATNFIRDNLEEAALIGAKYTGMDLATVKLALENIRYETALDIQGELEYVKFLNRLRIIKIENPLRFVEKIVTSTYLEGGIPKK